MCADERSGDDQARRLLSRARNAPAPRRSRRARRVDPQDQPWSGAGPDPRDPATVGDAVTDLVRDRKWDSTLKAAGVEGRWERIVGPDIAAHCRPAKLADGELVCVAESTAWATQVRLLAPQLLKRLGEELGPDVVSRIRVQGPTAPDWRHGPLRVTGRGPRDTYG